MSQKGSQKQSYIYVNFNKIHPLCEKGAAIPTSTTVGNTDIRKFKSESYIESVQKIFNQKKISIDTLSHFQFIQWFEEKCPPEDQQAWR